MEGRFALFMPKTRQERGKAGSQVIRKCRHLRQFGAILLISGSELEFCAFAAQAQVAASMEIDCPMGGFFVK